MPTLEIGGQSFECRASLPEWRLMELAASVKAKDPLAQMAGLHAFVVAVIKPDERERFVETMQALDDEEGGLVELDDAIGNLMVQYATPVQGVVPARPTKRSSVSPPSPESSGGTSRVASSSPDMPHRVMKLSRPAGRSIAS